MVSRTTVRPGLPSSSVHGARRRRSDRTFRDRRRAHAWKTRPTSPERTATGKQMPGSAQPNADHRLRGVVDAQSKVASNFDLPLVGDLVYSFQGTASRGQVPMMVRAHLPAPPSVPRLTEAAPPNTAPLIHSVGKFGDICIREARRSSAQAICQREALTGSPGSAIHPQAGGFRTRDDSSADRGTHGVAKRTNQFRVQDTHQRNKATVS